MCTLRKGTYSQRKVREGLIPLPPLHVMRLRVNSTGLAGVGDDT